MSTNLVNELWARIEQDSTDMGAYAVYGDLLQEAGDPRGELIALQCASEKETDQTKKKALHTSIDALLERHGAALLGPLAGAPESEVELRWFCGHLQAVTLRGARAEPVVERLQALLALPVARVLRKLTLTVRPARLDFSDDAGNVEPYGLLFAALTAQAAQLPETLRSLALGDGEPDLITGRLRIPRFAAELGPLERLESLTIRAGSATPGLVEGKGGLPQLRELALYLTNMENRGYRPRTSVTLDELAASSWPSLERLELWFGAQEICYINSSLDDVRARGREDASRMTLRQIENLDVSDYTSLSWEDFAPHLPSLVPPKVTWLGLGNLSFTDALVANLPQMPWWSRLRTLDLSHGTLTSTGAKALVARAAAYAHLDALILDGNTLKAGDVDAIRAVLPKVRAENQRSARQPAYTSRYVSSVE